MHKLGWFLVLNILFLSITGCVGVRPHDLSNLSCLSWRQRVIQLNKIQNWLAKGSIGVIYGGKSTLATFSWMQHGENYVINLSGPLNLGQIKISGNSTTVIIQNHAGRRLISDDPEKLIYDHTGILLPVTYLPYWLRALPSPDAPVITTHFDQCHHLLNLRQRGWQIDYKDFFTVATVDLPRMVTMHNYKAKIKLSIKSWQLLKS